MITVGVPVVLSVTPVLFCTTNFAPTYGKRNGPIANLMLPEANAALSNGMMKSGARANAGTVELGVATNVSNVVPPSVDINHQKLRLPPMEGVKDAVPLVKNACSFIALLKDDCEKMPVSAVVSLVEAEPFARDASAVTHVTVRFVPMKPPVPAASRKFVAISSSLLLRPDR
jgi:hypothetical protein